MLLPLTVGYFAFLHGVLFVGSARYHAPLYPVLSLLAAAGILRMLSSPRTVTPRGDAAATPDPSSAAARDQSR